MLRDTIESLNQVEIYNDFNQNIIMRYLITNQITTCLRDYITLIDNTNEIIDILSFKSAYLHINKPLDKYINKNKEYYLYQERIYNYLLNKIYAKDLTINNPIEYISVNGTFIKKKIINESPFLIKSYSNLSNKQIYIHITPLKIVDIHNTREVYDIINENNKQFIIRINLNSIIATDKCFGTLDPLLRMFISPETLKDFCEDDYIRKLINSEITSEKKYHYLGSYTIEKRELFNKNQLEMFDTYDLLLFRYLWEVSKNNITYNEPIKKKKKKKNKKHKKIEEEVKEEVVEEVEEVEEVVEVKEVKEEVKIEDLIKFKPNIIFLCHYSQYDYDVMYNSLLSSNYLYDLYMIYGKIEIIKNINKQYTTQKYINFIFSNNSSKSNQYHGYIRNDIIFKITKIEQTYIL